MLVAEIFALEDLISHKSMEMVMAHLEDYADDADDHEFTSIKIAVGTMVAVALTVFLLVEFILSPHAPPELAASELFLGP